MNYEENIELFELVAQFDAGRIARSEFQQRARALPNERLLALSRILAAGPGYGSRMAQPAGEGRLIRVKAAGE